MEKAICGVHLKDIRKAMELMLMLALNEAIYKLAMEIVFAGMVT